MKKPRQPNRAARGGRIDWDKQFRFDVEYARETLLNTGQVRPMFALHTPDMTIPVLVDTNDKPFMREMLRLMCIAHDAIGLMFMAEAWATTEPKMKPGETWDQMEQRITLPSKSDRRIEVVIVQSRYYDENGERQAMLSMREIERGADGKPSGLKPHTPSGGDAQGPTFDILPERRGTPEERETAKRLLQQLEAAGGMATIPVQRH